MRKGNRHVMARQGESGRSATRPRPRWPGVAAAASLVILLAACGISGQGGSPAATVASSPAATVAFSPAATVAFSPTATSGESAAPTGDTEPSPSAVATDAPSPAPAASPAGQLSFANWPLYIDIDEETGGYPTLEQFQEQAGIDVTYAEDINANEEFFGRLQPDLAAGNPTGYDLIVMTDWMIERMARLGYLEELDHSLLPNFEANAEDLFRDPWYDPGNRYSIPWQSGIVGIAYNPTLTGRPITTFDDLLDPEFAGRVGMFSEMRDTMSMALLSLGVEPVNATIEDVERARDKLLGPAQQGQFRAFYGNDYYDALAAGDLAITIAWSGDISQMKLYDNADVEFIVPESGGLLWVDSAAIPKAAEHPVDAHLLLDYFYDLDNAAPLTEYVGYFSPVRGVPDRVREDAQAARDEDDDEWADQLEVIADTAFPDEEQLENVFEYKRLTEEEERTWNELFTEVVTD
ncbi:MAG: spermidine/putrescine ABC transporter substrate-binding protein [Chloroflexota bacterium]|nr:spermidine/putrescine ABC transporter substrate-binding protein [Chloroflexota bacterium]